MKLFDALQSLVPLRDSGSVYRHQFPELWEGTVMAKKPDSVVPVHRVVAEICFKPGEPAYYDISAIDNHTDNSGIHHMFPVNAPLSEYFRPGCDWFPCNNCYIMPTDPHTRASDETDFIVEVGTKH
ncbi:hypothetical protein EYC84_000767 [Monilinia fructicola]|uniref:Uncharacterized protein n=1 Tax=Monilinia fructicola TaxID=38448 RepID=A0A5M9JK36_MONFR|nr:hypothetical protein EYC84_000767 [Monilinia fructicola]